MFASVWNKRKIKDHLLNPHFYKKCFNLLDQNFDLKQPPSLFPLKQMQNMFVVVTNALWEYTADFFSFYLLLPKSCRVNTTVSVVDLWRGDVLSPEFHSFMYLCGLQSGKNKNKTKRIHLVTMWDLLDLTKHSYAKMLIC